MNEYQIRLNNLRVRKVTANNFFTLSDLVEDYDKLAEDILLTLETSFTKQKELEEEKEKWRIAASWV